MVRFLKIGVILLVVVGSFVLGLSQTTVELTLLSHRHPTYEIYAQQLDQAVPGIRVNAMLMPVDKCMELARLAMAVGAPVPYDIVWVNDILLDEYASNGWLIPLDDYVKKYWDVYNFGDIPEAVWEGVKYQGHIYAIPTLTNVMMLFYRKDILEKYHLIIPKTLEEYIEVAKVIYENEKIYGVTLSFKPVDTLGNEFHSYLSALGGRWFDEQGFPAFNGPEGVKAVEIMKTLMKYAPPGVLTYANDESAAALQMGLAAMALQWFTRAATMYDPAVSKVVGLIAFAVPPSGSLGGVPAARLATDGYAIPKGIAHDPEVVFQVIAAGTFDQSKTSVYSLPPRRSFITSEIIERSPWYEAAFATIQAGARVQAQEMGQFMQVNEIVTRYVARALAGELDAKAALDRAAVEVLDLLGLRK
ncbi:MAG: sugar ABC transporter substrate-binding protein [Candidatus Hadarchaeum sp.]|uniref:ABC transporter substrate-binding protein n=1 Tax=Candidatus Hadarchaeum sp. TaxID=2883567 RepID=UPI0031786D59